MKEMFDDIREKLDEWEAPAPEGLWERIEEAGLQNARPSGIRPVLRKAAVAAGTVAAAAALAVMLLRPGHDDTGDIFPGAIPLTAEIRTDIDPMIPAVPRSIAPIKPIDEIKEKHTVLNSGGLQPSRIETVPITVPNPHRVNGPAAVTVERRVMKRPAGAGEENRLSKTGSAHSARTLSADIEGKEKSRKSAGLLSFGISTSNSPGTETSRMGYTRMTGYSAAPVTLPASNPTGMWIDPDANMRLANHDENVGTETRYRLPVRTGISLRYTLPANVSVETGVTYTWLSSTLRSGSEQNHYSTTTQMHYVGVPLNVSYTFFHNRLVDIYASAGGLMEKCVGGSIQTKYIMDGRSTGKDRTEPLNARPLQWSVNATAGVQLNITPAVGLYAEPGAAYYFDDGTSLQTTYKARPLNFYLRFGLRFSFGL